MKSKNIYALIVFVAIILYVVYGLYGCETHYNLPDEQQNREIYLDEPSGVLSHLCPDSAFMLNANDVLAVYNSYYLYEVYHVDSIVVNGTNVDVLIERIFTSSPDSPLCNGLRWDNLFEVYNEELIVRCKEIFQPYILAADTCQ